MLDKNSIVLTKSNPSSGTTHYLDGHCWMKPVPGWENDVLSLEHVKELIHISTIAELLPEETQVDVNNSWNTHTISKAQ